MPETRDRELDALYAAPLEEFVARRDALARSLRDAGDREAADAVKALRKPSVPAWTVNRLAREEKMRLRGLLTAGERLRAAHAGLLAGGAPDDLHAAREDERRAIAELARAAEALLEDAGHPATKATLERVERTLHAAAADEEVAERVRAGRLEQEEETTGFDLGFAAATAAPPRPRKAGERKPSKAEDAAREKLRRAEERLREARAGLAEGRDAVAARARELERAERELARREKEAERAEKEVEKARR